MKKETRFIEFEKAVTIKRLFELELELREKFTTEARLTKTKTQREASIRESQESLMGE